MEAGDGNGFGSDSEHDSDLDGAFQAFPILNSLSPPLASFPFPSFKVIFALPMRISQFLDALTVLLERCLTLDFPLPPFFELVPFIMIRFYGD